MEGQNEGFKIPATQLGRWFMTVNPLECNSDEGRQKLINTQNEIMRILAVANPRLHRKVQKNGVNKLSLKDCKRFDDSIYEDFTKNNLTERLHERN